jgi:Fe(3+) dicitrate transport protein
LAYFDRDWWRQSSNSQDGLHAGCNPTLTIDGVSATITQHRLAGRAIDPSTQVPCAQGRLRSYTTYGLEPRLTLAHDHGRVLAGIKLHREEQERLQVNAGSALGRSGAVVEDNLRESRVLSAFLGHEFEWGALSALPVLRHERIDAERRNRLNGTVGLRRFTATLYGLGLRYRIDARTGLFASLHRGFAPPRVEDLIGGTGTVTDVDPERSVNLELGFRTATDFGLSLEAALFRNDFANLIAVGSIAGGGTPLSEGEALFAGFELDARWDLPAGWFARLAYAYLPTAEQSTPFINVATRQPIAGSAAGLRQPYAPRHSGALSFGYATEHWDLSLEAQHLGRQYTDFANTVAVSADGQRGVIGGTTVYNLATNIRLGEQIGAFVAVKNLGDKVYVTDRTRGIQVGQPRLLQLGLRYGF